MTDRLRAAFEAMRDRETASPTGVLAPVLDATTADADAHYDLQHRAVRSSLPAPGATRSGPADGDASPRPTLEVGCRVGGLLARLAGDRPVLGADRHPAVLPYARDRSGAPVLAADPRRLPLPAGRLAGVVALEYVTGRVDATAGPGARDETAGPGAREVTDGLGRFLRAARRTLAPGGVLVLDVAEEPRAALDEDYVGAAGDYEFERTVSAGRLDADGAAMAVEYRLTAPDGATATAVEHVELALFDRSAVRERLREAGFTDVETWDHPDDDGAAMVSATVPRE